MLRQLLAMPAAASLVQLRVASTFALLCCLAACTSRDAFWSGAHRRGGVYAGPSRYYPSPGGPDDPWGPYIHEASTRYSVPEPWIREVMRAESDGQEQAVSAAGAMGLMQVMPDTYDGLRQRYPLGRDPFEPHDNIMAGAAYMREMYDRYGAPGFLAAYNAGPSRLDAYLNGSDSLPDETVNYVATITPHLGGNVRMTGPLAVYAQGGTATPVTATTVTRVTAPAAGLPSGGGTCDPNAAYDPDRQCAPAQAEAAAPVAMASSGVCDPDAAYDPSRACERTTATAPLSNPAVGASRSILYEPAASVALTNVPAPPKLRAMPPAAVSDGAWGIQVGAFSSRIQARVAANGVHDALVDLLGTAQIELLPTSPFGGKILYRARLSNLSAEVARTACVRLAVEQQPCIVVAPGQAS
jgi:D-alanyl-D-alanine carboxypeptidase